MNKWMGVSLVVVAALLIYPAAPDIVTWILILLLIGLLITEWPKLQQYFK